MSPRYQRHLHLPDKVIGWLDTAAVRAEIDRRRKVTSPDVIAVISDAAQIPKDMVFRDVGDRFKDIEQCLSRRVVGQKPAVKALAHRLVLNKGPLKDGFDRPDGVLLLPRADWRRQDGVGESGRRIPVRRREEDDPHRHVRVPGRRRVGGQTDWHAARASSAASGAAS